jgi:hypothetical protein
MLSSTIGGYIAGRLRTKDISDDVLNEVVKSLRKRVKIDHSYDIPYIAGYSKDGRTIYLDRHLPRSFRSWTSRVYVTPYLVTMRSWRRRFWTRSACTICTRTRSRSGRSGRR